MRSVRSAQALTVPRRRLALIFLGLAPLVVGSVIAVALLSGGAEQYGLSGLAPQMGVLFAVAIGYAAYALWRYPVPSDLPFIWAALILIEFVITPVIDIATNRYAGESHAFADSMGRAAGACTLFVVGLWAGTAAFGRHFRGQRPGTANFLPASVDIPGRTPLILLACAGVALLAELWVLGTSGIVGGDLAAARGAALIGTTAAMPLVRLADVATLLGSWYAEVGSNPTLRRRCGRMALVAAAVASLMPIMLQQRFGLLQTAMYFLLPKLIARKWLGWRSQATLLTVLPLLLVGAVGVNILTGAYRQLKMTYGSAHTEDILAIASSGGLGESHFRHLWLLSQLMRNGVDSPDFNGLYSGVPIVGDLLIILPRALFPSKPVTTMEVVNGVMFGRHFSALDRGSASVYTASVWNQFYMFGGTWGMVPLAAALAYFALMAWHAALRRASRPTGVVLATMLWVQLGWLTFNVALTSVELPGMLIAYFVARQLRRSSRPAAPVLSRGAQG